MESIVLRIEVETKAWVDHEFQEFRVVVVQGEFESVCRAVWAVWFQQAGYLVLSMDTFHHQIRLACDSCSESVSIVTRHATVVDELRLV